MFPPWPSLVQERPSVLDGSHAREPSVCFYRNWLSTSQGGECGICGDEVTMGGCRKLLSEQLLRHMSYFIKLFCRVGRVQRMGNEIDICNVLI
jgi:hypothetical protein